MEKTDKKNKIVLTGGGSGGHVIPCIALLPELSQNFDKIYYVGGIGIEKKLAADAGLKYFEIDTVGLNRTKLYKNFLIPLKLIKSTRDCVRFFKRVKPDVIFGKGGYVQMPAVLAARILHIPAVCHESDLTLGLANKIAYKLGAQILTGFSGTATLSSKFVYSGFPLRKSLFLGDKQKIILQYKLDTSKKTVLVLGGSLGAEAVNKAIYAALPALTKRYNVLHITGKGKAVNQPYDGYYAVEYADDIQDYYAAADVVVSRCGAGALSELSVLNKAAVFIPLPKSASRGDQLKNAEIAKAHGAKVIYQEDLSAETLINAIYQSGVKMTPVADVGNKKISGILTTFAENRTSDI